MPESRGKNLSAESIEALLLALGLSETERPGPKIIEPTSYTTNRVSNLARKSSLAMFPRPTAPVSHTEASEMDEAQMFGRDYLSDFDIYSEFGEGNDALDSDVLPTRPQSESFEVVDNDPTQRYSMSSDSTYVPSDILQRVPDSTIQLKVAHNAAIIMLRLPRKTSFLDLKRKLYDKFVNQQGIFLTHTFSVVLALRPGSMNSPLPSPDYERVSFAERTEMTFIDHESDWRRIVSHNDGSKITLRILDTPSY